LAERGDHRKVDMLVKDIYGGDCTSLGLPGDLIASSFGKVAANGANETIEGKWAFNFIRVYNLCLIAIDDMD